MWGKSDRSETPPPKRAPPPQPDVGEGMRDAVTQVKGRMMYRKTICRLHEPFHTKRRYPLRRSPDCKARAGRPEGMGADHGFSNWECWKQGKDNGTAELFMRRQWFRPKAILA